MERPERSEGGEEGREVKRVRGGRRKKGGRGRRERGERGRAVLPEMGLLGEKCMHRTLRLLSRCKRGESDRLTQSTPAL